MLIRTVSTTPGGAPTAAETVWQVSDAAGGASRPSFRRVLYLTLRTGGLADRVVVDASATRLPGAFAARDRVLSGGGLQARLTGAAAGQALVVRLDDYPERVLRVTLDPEIAQGRVVELFRMDGSVPAAGASASGASGAALAAKYKVRDVL